MSGAFDDFDDLEEKYDETLKDNVPLNAGIGAADMGQGEKMIENGFSIMLQGLQQIYPKLDIEDENFRETPQRVMRSWVEMFRGLDEEPLEKIFSKSFPSTYDGMVTANNIICFSMCPHHFLPVKYKIDFAYMPGKSVLGISKLTRFIEHMACMPALQEDFTKGCIDVFNDHVKPKGSMIIVEGYHLCMGARGIKKPEVATKTSWVQGDFNTNNSLKEEFLRMCRLV